MKVSYFHNFLSKRQFLILLGLDVFLFFGLFIHKKVNLSTYESKMQRLEEQQKLLFTYSQLLNQTSKTLADIQTQIVSNKISKLTSSVPVGSVLASALNYIPAEITCFQTNGSFSSCRVNGSLVYLNQKLTPTIYVVEITESYVVLSDGSCYIQDLQQFKETNEKEEKKEGVSK